MARRGTTAEIDLEELEKLCALQCTDEELALWFKVSTRTIERRRQEPEFGEAMQRGKARGRMSIRRAQMRMLEAGNPAIAIWLGKQYLNQSDRPTTGDGIGIYIMVGSATVREPQLDQSGDALEEADHRVIDIGPAL